MNWIYRHFLRINICPGLNCIHITRNLSVLYFFFFFENKLFWMKNRMAWIILSMSFLYVRWKQQKKNCLLSMRSFYMLRMGKDDIIICLKWIEEEQIWTYSIHTYERTAAEHNNDNNNILCKLLSHILHMVVGKCVVSSFSM